MSQQWPNFSLYGKTKVNDIRPISGKLVSSGTSRVAFASVLLGENRLKKLIIMITRNVLLSAQMGERASVVLICIITSRYNEVK